MGWIEKIFGNTSAKEIRRIEPIVREIESYDVRTECGSFRSRNGSAKMYHRIRAITIVI